MSEISDGKLYRLNDMARIGCNDCSDCSECCRNEGNTIILDPYDIFCLKKGLGCSFEELLKEDRIELGVVDGIIQPDLKLRDNGMGCSFLDAEGRCSIHDLRPGFCRLFPLGRIYNADGTFSYFLQVKECPYPNKSKVKIRNWLGIDNIEKYEQFVTSFHNILMQMRQKLSEQPEREKALNMMFLNHFYVQPYDIETDIFSALEERICSFYELISSN